LFIPFSNFRIRCATLEISGRPYRNGRKKSPLRLAARGRFVIDLHLIQEPAATTLGFQGKPEEKKRGRIERRSQAFRFGMAFGTSM